MGPIDRELIGPSSRALTAMHRHASDEYQAIASNDQSTFGGCGMRGGSVHDPSPSSGGGTFCWQSG